MQVRRRPEAGFTLLELLMVVIIIAILASLALPQYFRATERSRTGQVLQLLGSLRGSELRFKAQQPANVYDNSANATGLDLSPVPGTANGPALPGGWGWLGTAVVNGNAAGANIQIQRTAGLHANALLNIDLDTGNVCSNDNASANDWAVGLSGTC